MSRISRGARSLPGALALIVSAGCYQISNVPTPKACPSGTASRFDGNAWQCEPVPAQSVPTSPCPSGQVVNWESNGTWGCLSLPSSAPLPSSACPIGTASQWNGAVWQCVTIPQQILPTCNATQAVTWNNGAWGCTTVATPLPAPPGNCSTGLSWNSATAAWSCAESDAIVPAGTVIAYAGNVTNPPPNGWLWCNGNSYPAQTPYDKLFAAIGTTYGVAAGNPAGFKVPDYRGYFLRGFDPSGTIDPGPRSTIIPGGTPGAGSIESDAFRAHTHGFLASLYGTSATGLTDSTFSLTTGVNPPGPMETFLHTTTASAGGGETRPANMAVNYLIKY